jgi:hypothetical protein
VMWVGWIPLAVALHRRFAAARLAANG